MPFGHSFDASGETCQKYDFTVFWHLNSSPNKRSFRGTLDYDINDLCCGENSVSNSRLTFQSVSKSFKFQHWLSYFGDRDRCDLLDCFGHIARR